jgi:hypothetical protein
LASADTPERIGGNEITARIVRAAIAYIARMVLRNLRGVRAFRRFFEDYGQELIWLAEH